MELGAGGARRAYGATDDTFHRQWRCSLRSGELPAGQRRRATESQSYDTRAVPSNKGMKLAKLSSAPGGDGAPPSALQRFALVRTASQLIPGVRRTRGECDRGIRQRQGTSSDAQRG